MGEHIPLRVRADLAAGLAFTSPWGIALDGLLAASVWGETKAELVAQGKYGQRALHQQNPPDLELPLARCTAAGDFWHWSATCSYPVGRHPDQQVHIWTGRVDRRDMGAVAARLPKVISSRQGRYRSRRMPLLVTACSAVTWHAIGDLAAITALLAEVTSIGKKRSTGEGHVLRWTVTPAPDLDTFTAAHLHPDGSLGRPTPSGCFPDGWAGPTGGEGTAGLRPPYMHTSRQHTLRLPVCVA